MIKSRRTFQLIGLILCLLLAFGCAPPREKANEDEVHTGGSEELDAALRILEQIGLDLDLDDISTLGEQSAAGVSNLLPTPSEVAGNTAEINQAIDRMEEALEQIDDPESFEASYLHLYLGYSYILSATSELLTVDPDIITQSGDSYEFDTTASAPTTTPEAQAVANAVYTLTGNSYSNTSLGVTGPDAATLSNQSNAVSELQQSIDMIEDILPDSDPAELDQLRTELTDGVTDDLEATIVTSWGFVLSP